MSNPDRVHWGQPFTWGLCQHASALHISHSTPTNPGSYVRIWTISAFQPYSWQKIFRRWIEVPLIHLRYILVHINLDFVRVMVSGRAGNTSVLKSLSPIGASIYEELIPYFLSDNGLSPLQHRAITLSNVVLCQLDHHWQQSSVQIGSKCKFQNNNKNVVCKMAAILYRLQCVK